MTCRRCGDPMREVERASDNSFVVYGCPVNKHHERVGDVPPLVRMRILPYDPAKELRLGKWRKAWNRRRRAVRRAGAA